MSESVVAPEIVFNFSARQNHFFVELGEVLLAELTQLGAKARIAFDEYPEPRQGRVVVLMPPHEYVAVTGFRPPRQILQRCIGISAEQPSTPHFAQDVELAGEFGAMFDINPRAVREYARRGVAAQRLTLGYTRSWDRFDCDHRDIDILFMGRVTERRAKALSRYADVFARYRCHIQLWDNSRPATAQSRGFLRDDEKRGLLSRSKVVLSNHGDEEPYFEWLRVVEAICAGCAVVSEHSTDIEPLVPGEDLITGDLDRLDLLCAALLEDDKLRERIRRSGSRRLKEKCRLQRAAESLLEAALRIDGQPMTEHGTAASRLNFLASSRRGGFEFPLQPPPSEFTPEGRSILRTLKSQTISMLSLRRRLDLLERTVREGAPPDLTPSITYESAAWEARSVRPVSVIVPLYNHGEEVVHALTSVLRSEDRDFEIVVVDDSSTDGGGGIVETFMREHQELPARLVTHPINRGLPHGRNTGVAYATGDLLLMLDADNELRSSAIRKLRAALAQDPGASFAYGILERFDSDGPQGLVSALPWEPQNLRRGNYIDALAMIRREALEALDGYTTDSRIHGWEDFDLWVRMAEAHRHGAFVPEMIARYRVGVASMISMTNISVTDAFGAIVEHAPRLMSGLQVP